MKKNNDRFVAIDFETMTIWRACVCSVGVAVFEKGKMVDKFYSLICPPSKEENKYCCQTHGLSYKDVKDAPKFSDIWPIIDKKYIKGSPLVAHNASFEKSCINTCGEEFGTKTDYKYIDTLKLSRENIGNIKSYSLNFVCEALGFKMGQHHNALDDAIACGEVFVRINKLKGILNG